MSQLLTISLFDLLKLREIKLKKNTAKPFGKVEAKLINKKDILRMYLSKGSLSNCEEVADGVAERSVTDLARLILFKLDLNDGLYQITDGRDYKQTGFWSVFKFGMILTMGRSGPREQWEDLYRQMWRPAESSEVAGVINRGNTSVATCFSCSTEESVGIKLMHKMGSGQCHFAKGKSQPKHYEQAFWLDLYWPSGGTLCPALGPILPRRCRVIGESLEDSSGNKQ